MPSVLSPPKRREEETMSWECSQRQEFQDKIKTVFDLEERKLISQEEISNNESMQQENIENKPVLAPALEL